MIDIKDLRENPEKYRLGAKLKNVAVDIDAILSLDKQRLRAQQEFERARSEQNEASKVIGKLKDPAEKKSAIEKVGGLSETVKAAQERAKAAEGQLTPLLL